MIDFRLTELDQEILDDVHRQALICRQYARYYDEHEEAFVPDALPDTEAAKSSQHGALGQETPNEPAPARAERSTYRHLPPPCQATDGQHVGDVHTRDRQNEADRCE